jgi:RNase adapter protein RapZ
MNTTKRTKNGCKVIRIVSFGFKYGAPPQDAAFTLDCRGLVNPHYEEKLRPKTGASRAVADYLKGDKEVRALLKPLPTVLGALLPGLITRSKYHPEVKLCFGCTGGKHRSRFFALSAAAIVRNLIAQHPQWGCRVVVNHRDSGRE